MTIDERLRSAFDEVDGRRHDSTDVSAHLDEVTAPRRVRFDRRWLGLGGLVVAGGAAVAIAVALSGDSTSDLVIETPPASSPTTPVDRPADGDGLPAPADSAGLPAPADSASDDSSIDVAAGGVEVRETGEVVVVDEAGEVIEWLHFPSTTQTRPVTAVEVGGRRRFGIEERGAECRYSVYEVDDAARTVERVGDGLHLAASPSGAYYAATLNEPGGFEWCRPWGVEIRSTEDGSVVARFTDEPILRHFGWAPGRDALAIATSINRSAPRVWAADETVLDIDASGLVRDALAREFGADADQADAFLVGWESDGTLMVHGFDSTQSVYRRFGLREDGSVSEAIDLIGSLTAAAELPDTGPAPEEQSFTTTPFRSGDVAEALGYIERGGFVIGDQRPDGFFGHTVGIYRRPDGLGRLWLQRATDIIENSPPTVLADAVSYEEAGAEDSVARGCERDGEPIELGMGVVRWTDEPSAELLPARAAWQVDLDTGTFVVLDPAGVRCSNDAAGL